MEMPRDFLETEGSGGGAGPGIKVSANGRFLVKDDGTPVRTGLLSLRRNHCLAV